MFISAVILSYNSSQTLPKCLDNLIPVLESYQEKHNQSSEVFVVENGSQDGSRELLEKYRTSFPNIVKPILFEKNTGTTYSRNAAIKKATGKYILVLDSDAYVNKDAIDELITYLESDAETGLAVPRLLYASGNFQLSCDAFPTLWLKAKRFLFLKQMESKESDLSQCVKPVAVDYAISACWMLTKECVDNTGLLDENIFYSPEDVDYCIRVWKSGYKITYVPNAELVHDAQELSRGFKLSKFHFSHLKGLFYLFNKHRYFWTLKRLYKKMPRHI